MATRLCRPVRLIEQSSTYFAEPLTPLGCFEGSFRAENPRYAIGMSHYLVRAQPILERLPEPHEQLQADAFISLHPFGKAPTYSLNNARTESDSTVILEEEDYCSPPLA